MERDGWNSGRKSWNDSGEELEELEGHDGRVWEMRGRENWGMIGVCLKG